MYPVPIDASPQTFPLRQLLASILCLAPEARLPRLHDNGLAFLFIVQVLPNDSIL